MDNDKKLYLYSGLAIALSVVAYVVITRKRKLETDAISTVNPDIKTNTGDTVTYEQTVVDSPLLEILKLPLSQVKAKMIGKNIYSKIENINPRQTPYVNNGLWVNNSVGGRITDKNTLIGTVTDVVNDKGLLHNSSGNVYKWFKVKPSADAIKQIKDDSNFFLGGGVKTEFFYVREDVIKL